MKTKWGVIGCGGIARRRTIPEGITEAANAELTAVYDVNQKANAEVAEQFGGKACATEEELIDACDIVYIATPANLHCAQVEKAAKAGKHVLCEKPLGMTIEEGDHILNVCAKHKVKLGTAFMMRFQAQHQEALKLVREGRLGTLVYGRAQLSCWYPPIPGAWRQNPATSGGGSLIDMGGHCIDILEMFFGPIKRVACMTGNLVQKYASEDTAVAILEFESGAKGCVDSLFNVPDISSKNRLEIYGSLGSILADNTIGQGEAGEMTAYLEESGKGYEAQQLRDETGGIRIVPTPVNMYRAEVETFADAVLNNTDPPVDGEAGQWSQKVLAACYEAAKTRQVVCVR